MLLGFLPSTNLSSTQVPLSLSSVVVYLLSLNLFSYFLLLQRAMRVRSHSMETMVGSHRHRSPGVGGGVPASLSGGGLPQSTSECTKSTFTVSKKRNIQFINTVLVQKV